MARRRQLVAAIVVATSALAAVSVVPPLPGADSLTPPPPPPRSYSYRPAGPRPMRRSTAACPIAADTRVVVYAATGAGGVGQYSREWTRRFFSWWAASNEGDLVWLELPDPASIATDCNLLDFPNLTLYVQPGGSALNQVRGIARQSYKAILDCVSW